jgi:hypothetical protein
MTSRVMRDVSVLDARVQILGQKLRGSASSVGLGLTRWVQAVARQSRSCSPRCALNANSWTYNRDVIYLAVPAASGRMKRISK